MESFKTIECLLVPSEWIPPSKANPDSVAVASEGAKQFIWQLSVASTQLCKELNEHICQHPDFETWKRNGCIPSGTLKRLWNVARRKAPYAEMPERFQRSALLRLENIYAGWFKIQEKLLSQLNKLNRWLSIAKSDQELIEISGCELEQIQARANELICEIRTRLDRLKQSQTATNKQDKNYSKPADPTVTQSSDRYGRNKENRSLINELYNLYFSLVEQDTRVLDQCAISHLIKNRCEIATELEDPKKFTFIYQKRHKKAQRIEQQLEARLPQIKDLGDDALKALSDSPHVVHLNNAEFVAQLANIQRRPSSIPYPLLFYSGDDLTWQLIKRRDPVTQQIQDRIFVRFKGLKTYLRNQLQQLGPKQSELNKEYIFEVRCDRRQHQIFQQFLKDYQTYAANKKQYSVGLFLFKSAALLWRETTKHECFEHQLYLQCTIDYRCLTAEGTELAKAEKIAEVQRKLKQYETKQQRGEEATNAQQTNYKSLQNQLHSLDHPFSRPSKPPYKGEPNIIVGVSFSLEQLATVAVVDCSSQQVLAYRSIRQLLGKDYQLLSAYRLEQRRNANERHKRQKQGKANHLSEANKGKHLNRLLAKAIVDVAQAFKAGSLALPNLTGLRESIQSEIAAKAELNYPGDRAKQQQYQKQYKINVHRWSYARLTHSIKDRASKVGMPLEVGQQPLKEDSQTKAVQIAISAYLARQGIGK